MCGLLTTAPVISVAMALDIMRLYQHRRRIEACSRTSKNSGSDLEGAMVDGVHALKNLVARGAISGVAVRQRLAGRDAGPERRARDVIDAPEEAFAALARTLQIELETRIGV